NEFGYGNSAAGRERSKNFAQQFPAAFPAFTVQDVSKRREMVSAAVVHFEQVARNSLQTIRDSVLLRHFCGHFEDGGPIDGGQADFGGLFSERDAPHTGTGGDVQHVKLGSRFGNAQMFSQLPNSRVTQRKERFNKSGEKFRALVSFVHRCRRFASPDHLAELKPLRDELRGHVLEQSAMVGGFGGDEEGGAF